MNHKIPGGFYWFLISDGWRIGELDTSTGDVYWTGVENPVPVKSLSGVRMDGPISVPVSSLVVGMSPGITQIDFTDDKGKGV